MLPVYSQSCETDNAALQSMPESTVVFTKESGDVLEVLVRTANNNSTRAAGFQGVCESTIEAKPILFLFSSALTPRFHMNNVVAPIDIAFIDTEGKIDTIHEMTPYVIGSKHRPLYGSSGPVIAALEVHKGFYSDNGIDLSTRVTWK